MVVLPDGCDSEVSSCGDDRGGIFQTNTSTTWTSRNSTAGNTYAVAVNPGIGLIPTVQYGSDTVALSYLGSGTPALAKQLVGGITSTDLFTGIFGLNPLATNFSSDSPEVASYMSTLKAQNEIPSLSYGYTAGNGYRFNTVLASLTLGGYDASLFNPNNLTFAFNTQGNDLTVNIESISQTSASSNNTLSSTSFPAFIDTTTPYLFLPNEVCDKFEEAFGLTYDNTSGLYLVNDTLHNTLISENANITFTLGNSTSSETADIILPYAAFNLIASWPLVDTPSYYFPLKRANITSQITLGRTFLQEAYLIADYERNIFSVHQMKWDPNASAAITSILSPSASPAPASADVSKSKNNNVPTTAIVAATICGAVFLTVLAASIILIRQRQKKLNILIKTPPTPASAVFATTAAECTHCHSNSSTPEPMSQNSAFSTQTSSMDNARRLSTTPPLNGLALAPISPMSPVQMRSLGIPQSPTSPGGGPVIPPHFSSLDRVAPPTSCYSAYRVPSVASNIHELPAREEVVAEMVGTPVESVLNSALDQVIANHTLEQTGREAQRQRQSYQAYQLPNSPPPLTRESRRHTGVHSPIYGQSPTSIQSPDLEEIQGLASNRGIGPSSERKTSQWVGAHSPAVHSPVYGQESATLNRGSMFTFDIHPQLRTAFPRNSIQPLTTTRPHPQTRTQTVPIIQIRAPTQRATHSQYPPQTRTQGQDQAQNAGRGRDLMREHEERMREWRAMRDPQPTTSGPVSPPPQHREGEVASPVSPTVLDAREYSWLRLDAGPQ
ncbi:acid protease [Acephala macrosclerotiorum]|nr:acid protease [Acephala macrosclerotiorum]